MFFLTRKISGAFMSTANLILMLFLEFSKKCNCFLEKRKRKKRSWVDASAKGIDVMLSNFDPNSHTHPRKSSGLILSWLFYSVEHYDEFNEKSIRTSKIAVFSSIVGSPPKKKTVSSAYKSAHVRIFVCHLRLFNHKSTCLLQKKFHCKRQISWIVTVS